MSCKFIDLGQSPHDDESVRSAHETGGCPGVGNHFGANPIAVGDCIVVDGQAYRITAVKVLCEGSSVYSAGSPGTSVPDHTHNYPSSPNQVKLWLDPMPQEELEICDGY